MLLEVLIGYRLVIVKIVTLSTIGPAARRLGGHQSVLEGSYQDHNLRGFIQHFYRFPSSEPST